MESKMTFRDLENLIECNIVELQDQQITFKNKADGLQEHYFTAANTNEKDRTNMLCCVNEQLEREIENVNTFIDEMERRIKYLEECARPDCKNSPLLNNRKQLYDVVEYINAYIYNCKEEVQLEETTSLQLIKTNDQDTSIEVLARMMMNLLESLETVEVSLEKMRSHMHCINWKNKILEEKLFHKPK